MRKLILILALFIAAALAPAQVSNPTMIFVSAAPSGACTTPQPAQLVISSGAIWTCQSGTWGQISGGGGSGTVTSVAMTAPPGFTIIGSPITSSGTINLGTTGLTQNFIIKTLRSAGQNGITNSQMVDDGVDPVVSPNGYDVSVNGGYDVEVPNNTTTGTIVQTAACDDGTGHVLTCPHATSTINQPLGFVVGGTALANATVCTLGWCLVKFDNTAVARDYAIESATVDGELHDTGLTTLTANQPNFFIWTGNTGAGTAAVVRLLNALDFNAAAPTSAVTSITDSSTVQGALTFTGTGVSQTGTTFTFTNSGANAVQYNPSTTNIVIMGSSNEGVTSSCVETSLPSDTAPITAGSVSSGIGSFTGTNTYTAGCVTTLSKFSGGATGLNGQSCVVSATGLSGSAFQCPVTGGAIASTGTGQAQVTYNLTGALSREPFVFNHGTVTNFATSAQTLAGAVSAYSTTAHTLSPAVTGNPGFLIIGNCIQDFYNGVSLASMESSVQSLWTAARADNWTAIIQSTCPAYNQHGGGSVENLQRGQYNSFLRSMGPTSVNVAAGAYWDRIVEPDALFSDGFDPTFVIQSGAIGHYTDVANKRRADQINEALSAQGTNEQIQSDMYVSTISAYGNPPFTTGGTGVGRSTLGWNQIGRGEADIFANVGGGVGGTYFFDITGGSTVEQATCTVNAPNLGPYCGLINGNTTGGEIGLSWTNNRPFISTVNGSFSAFTPSNQQVNRSNVVYGWTNSTTDINQTVDTGISRDAADTVDVGNGTQGDKSGTINAANLNLTGTCTGCGTSSANWPPSASSPTFSPPAGSVTSGTTITDTCPGSSTPWVSSGTTPVAGGTGIIVSSSTVIYGSCQGSGYFTTGSAAYTISGGFVVVNNQFLNGSSSSLTSANLPAFSSALTNGSIILVHEYSGGTPSSFPVPTDTAGNTYVDCGPGITLWNGSADSTECFYALNTHTTSANVVQIHSSSAVQFLSGLAFELTGAASSSPIDGGSGIGYSAKANAVGGTAGANNLTATSLTPAGNGDLIIAMFNGTSSTPTAGTSPNAFTNVNGSANAMSEYFFQSVSAAITATAGDATSNDPYAAITIAIKP